MREVTHALLLLVGLIVCSHADEDESSLGVLRAARCVIPNGPDHITRAALLQQCISRNYAQGNETQCFPQLGCFPTDSPWTSTLRPFPSPLPPAEINLRLYCYTRASPERYNVTLWPKVSLEGCPFNASLPTVFITHGFASDGNSSWLAELRDAYLQQVDANAFLVDWGQGAQLLNYLQVASNTRIAGAELARFLRFLRDEKALKPEQVHLIGHSLGAHISAYAAKNVTGIGRLTALDPAQPGFEGQPRDVRLDSEDADFVDVLHTNAAPFIPLLGFGLIFPRGDVDVYMNGGLKQPGCLLPENANITSISDLAKYPVEVLNNLVSCSHGRSYEYFTETLLSNCTIWAYKASLTREFLNAGTIGIIDPVFTKVSQCDPDSCLAVGLETPSYSARGSFVASTSPSRPFCETDPKVTKRILAEVKVIGKGASGKVTEVLSEGVDQGKSVTTGITASLRKLTSLGKK